MSTQPSSEHYLLNELLNSDIKFGEAFDAAINGWAKTHGDPIKSAAWIRNRVERRFDKDTKPRPLGRCYAAMKWFVDSAASEWWSEHERTTPKTSEDGEVQEPGFNFSPNYVHLESMDMLAKPRDPIDPLDNLLDALDRAKTPKEREFIQKVIDNLSDLVEEYRRGEVRSIVPRLAEITGLSLRTIQLRLGSLREPPPDPPGRARSRGVSD
ncbi:MAG: hypothetical protein KDA16_00865 [Phycisphaerales bacterium]|nr:hypothetical protein [Phycisphaerales bacterium]